jgi:4a-hydroxytetrahydrobiopterin dehydratase
VPKTAHLFNVKGSASRGEEVKMDTLIKRKCVACDEKTPRVSPQEVSALSKQLNPGWQVTDAGGKLERRFTFPDFRRAMAFLNELAEVAEAEQHHPDFCLQGYNKVDVTLFTHAIGGLSENDFIVAAKLDVI